MNARELTSLEKAAVTKTVTELLWTTIVANQCDPRPADTIQALHNATSLCMDLLDDTPVELTQVDAALQAASTALENAKRFVQPRRTAGEALACFAHYLSTQKYHDAAIQHVTELYGNAVPLVFRQAAKQAWQVEWAWAGKHHVSFVVWGKFGDGYHFSCHVEAQKAVAA